MKPRAPHAAACALAGLLALAACGDRKGKDVDTLDRELTGNAADGNQIDPALTSALEDQIMVDPALTQARTGTAPRPGATPAQAPVPATRPAAGGPATPDGNVAKAPPPKAAPGQIPVGTTLGELAKMQASPARPGIAACIRNIQYGMAWARRLPANLPLYADAQVSEAAGRDAPGCALRVVSFVSGATVDRLVDFYFSRARQAGFAAEHQVSGRDHVVAGERGEGAFYATFHAARDGRTEVDLVLNDVR